MNAADKTLDKIKSLSMTRGFVYPGSDIYGGLANTWDLMLSILRDCFEQNLCVTENGVCFATTFPKTLSSPLPTIPSIAVL